jgi:hypothetical protein
MSPSPIAPETSTPEQREQARQPETDRASKLLRQAAELFEYASYYLSAKADEAKLSLRQVIVRVALEAIGVLAAAGLIVVAVALVFIGLGEGLGEAFGHRPWLGNLVSGLILSSLVGAWICLRVMVIKKHFLKKTVEHYEQRKLRQQTKFGRTVTDQAAAAPPND